MRARCAACCGRHLALRLRAVRDEQDRGRRRRLARLGARHALAAAQREQDRLAERRALARPRLRERGLRSRRGRRSGGAATLRARRRRRRRRPGTSPAPPRGNDARRPARRRGGSGRTSVGGHRARDVEREDDRRLLALARRASRAAARRRRARRSAPSSTTAAGRWRSRPGALATTFGKSAGVEKRAASRPRRRGRDDVGGDARAARPAARAAPSGHWNVTGAAPAPPQERDERAQPVAGRREDDMADADAT